VLLSMLPPRTVSLIATSPESSVSNVWSADVSRARRRGGRSCRADKTHYDRMTRTCQLIALAALAVMAVIGEGYKSGTPYQPQPAASNVRRSKTRGQSPLGG
jgi:hypothetical protein